MGPGGSNSWSEAGKEPENEVYCVVGDSSFQMLHSEIMTIMQEKQKVNILIFDNCGFGCINNLEMNHESEDLATEFPANRPAPWKSYSCRLCRCMDKVWTSAIMPAGQ